MLKSAMGAGLSPFPSVRALRRSGLWWPATPSAVLAALMAIYKRAYDCSHSVMRSTEAWKYCYMMKSLQ